MATVWKGLGLGAVLCSGLALAGCASESAARQDPAVDAGAAESALEYPNWETVGPGENAEYNQRSSLLQRGRLVYGRYCVGCHGEYGDGEGPASERLITQPRDFTKGIYKFRSTDSSSLPTEEDLYRTITRGLARVSMPAFPLMPENDKIAVVEYVKSFYPQWDERDEGRRTVPIPRAPADLAAEDRVRRGRVVYLATQCSLCHGVDGRGTGATQTEYTDAWGDPQKPFDFTRGGLKGGNSPEDIYRTFHTGLRSIMPSFGGDTLARITLDVFDRLQGVDEVEKQALRPFAEQFPTDGAAFSALTAAEREDLAERNSWDLVAYVLSLRTGTSTSDAVLGPAGIRQPASR